MDELKKELKEIILRLHALRPQSKQFVFFSTIFPNSMISLRKSIVEFKKVNKDSNEIDFILFSPGGMADDSYRIIRTLRKNFEIVNVIVPFWAKSAATILSLGANKIIVDEFGEFGPLDAQLAKPREDGPQYDRESALNDEHSVSIIENHFKMMYEEMYIRLFEHKKINIPKSEISNQLLSNLSKFFKPLLSQIDPYKLGDKQRKLDIGSQYATRILFQFGSPHDLTAARTLVNYLIHECPDHGYVIDKDILEKFVNNVYYSTEFGEEYKNTLQELSLNLIDIDEEIEYIGFILPEKIEENGENTSSVDRKEESGDASEPENREVIQMPIENGKPELVN